MIDTDYENGQVVIKRGEKVTKTFTFKDFVSAKEFKPVNKLKNDLAEIANGKAEKTQKEVETLERKFYEQVTQVGLKNPLPYEEALEIMTVPELGKLSEEILIFLVNWSSIDEVKQFGKQLSETQQKEEKH